MIKRYLRILVAILPLTVFFIVIFSQFVQAQANTTQLSTQKDQVLISFDTPIPLNSFANKTKDSSFDSVSVQSSFSINGRTFQDFVTVTSSQKVEEIRKNFLSSRQSIIATLKKDGFFDEKVSSLEISKDINTSGVVNIKNITLYGEKQAISKLADKFIGAKVEYKSDQEKVQGLRTETINPTVDTKISVPNEKTNNQTSGSNIPYYMLVPKSGLVNTGIYTLSSISSVNKTRGIVNYMRWDANNFASDQTYEHDFFLSKNQGTYFARKFSIPPWCEPVSVYWVTSWGSNASPYIDSELEKDGGCGTGNGPYIGYTIGAARASAITMNREHITAIFMPDGDSTTDTFLLQGQVGYRNPILCYSTLCSFGYGYDQVETTHYSFIKNGVVPGSQSWTFNGSIPDTPREVVVLNPKMLSLQVDFLDVTWDETNIILERKKFGDTTWTTYDFGVLRGSNNTVTRYHHTDPNLSAGTKYCYRLKAINAIGSSPYSNEACGTTLGGGTTPLAPSEVSVASPTINSLRLLFKDNATDETNIYIERKTRASGAWSQVLATNILPNANYWSWTNGGLASGTTYCYRLRASNASGYSPYSPEACGLTSGSTGSAPLSPSDLSVTDPTTTSLKVNFRDNATNENNFSLERKVSTNGGWLPVANIEALSGTGIKSYGDTNLSAGTTYCYRVRAYNNYGYSTYSNEACGITTNTGTIPLAPSDVSITNSTTNSLQVNFRDNALNEVSFTLERKTGLGGWGYLNSITALSSNYYQYYTDYNLSAGVTYCYRLQAHNANGSSSYSNETCGTTTNTGTAPNPPSDVSVTNATTNSLRVNFRDNALNENSFVMERKIGSGGWGYLVSFSALSGNYFQYHTDSNLSSGVTYCYRIFASNNYGNSSYSNESCGTTTSTGTVPNAPSNVYVSNATTTTLRLNFKDNSFNETWFPIERKVGNGNWMWLKSIQALSGNYTQWITDSGLIPKTQYCYRMFAINENGTSPYSNEGCGVTQ